MKYFINEQDRKIFQNRFYDLETEELLCPIETQNYTIVQVAQSYYNGGFLIEDHNQFCDLELTFSHINGLLCATGGVFENVDKNQLYLSLKGDVHSLKSRKSARFQTLAINFKDGPCLPLLSAIMENSKDQRTFYMPAVFSALTEMLTECRLTDAQFSRNYLDSLITSVLVKIARHGDDAPPEEILSCDEKLSAIAGYIDTHFLQICSLEELSAVFGYSYSHLSRIFKKAYDLTPRDYLLSRKMDYACALLKEGAELEEIAEVLGYATAFNFSRVFRSKTGLSPSAYKKQYEKSKQAE